MAASYPPHGIHTLIIGETGVGKSLLAEEMWHYIQQRNPDQMIPYVVFNCAEYADNPQLLLSQLFGYEKGAFTGAESPHAGLVEKADGGVLFLDEMHRLPATGQEMLFTLIDKKQFRRMGSTTDRTVDLMIIGATTEDPDQSFLRIFTRRIPILIQLPNLNERPLNERMNLVSLFLSREANRLGLAICVSAGALKLMISFQGETNIGELRNEIQLCCARSFLLYMAKPETDDAGVSFIRVTSRCLSRKMKTSVSADVRVYLDAYRIKDMMIYPDHAPDKFSAHLPDVPLDFYRFVEDRISVYNAAQRDVIITYCLTGMGSACRARELLLKSPPISMAAEIVAMGIGDDIQAAARQYGSRLKLIIGLFLPQIPGVLFVSMESIASPGGINRVILLLQGWKALGDEKQWNRRNLSLRSRFDQIAQKMQYFAPSLDAEQVKRQALWVVERLMELYREKLADDVLVRVFIHTAAMFERITISDPVPIPEKETRMAARYQAFFDQLRRILEEACRPFGRPVSLSEVYFFMLTVPDPETMEEIRLE